MSDEKSVAYTEGNDDRLFNFKALGEESGTDPMQILMVYLGKHWMALRAYINKGVEPSDGIQSTIYDIQNYCDLLLAMVDEKESPRE